MKVLVTGADGLLGSNVVRRLLEKDFEVKALIYHRSKSPSLNDLPVDKILGDITSAKTVGPAVRGCDAVFHVAASTALWPPRAEFINEINITGTKNVLDAAEEHGVKRVVHVGSASSFGIGTKKNPGTEETPYCYANYGLDYYDSKFEAQKEVLRRVAQGRVDAVIVNPTFMFGEHDYTPSSGQMIIEYLKMKLPVYTPGGRNFIHVRDAADGLILAYEKGKTGECYILGNENLSMKEILTIISKQGGVRAPFIEAPKGLMMAAGRIGSLAGQITGKMPAISTEIARNSATGAYYSPAKAVRELGLPQTPVEQAIEDSYRWLKEHRYL